MFMCSEKNTGQNHNTKTTSPLNMWQNKNTCKDSKTSNNDMFGEIIPSRLNSEKACYIPCLLLKKDP